jgi:hypothetical protein
MHYKGNKNKPDALIIPENTQTGKDIMAAEHIGRRAFTFARRSGCLYRLKTGGPPETDFNTEHRKATTPKHIH